MASLYSSFPFDFMIMWSGMVLGPGQTMTPTGMELGLDVPALSPSTNGSSKTLKS
jgi:hypothetical protein